MTVNLKNKTIVITGSSRGIGRALAMVLARENAEVVINYFQSGIEAENLLTEINGYNKNCSLFKADVTCNKEVQKLYQFTIGKYNKIDILINNAGTCDDNLLPMMTEQQWYDVININLNATFLCSRMFSKYMIRNRGGKIINIASLKGQIGSEGQTNYSASKAGVIGFTKALAKELARFDICVNAVCPGFIMTDMNKDNVSKKILSRQKTALTHYDYLNSLLNFLTFMCSDQFHSITGQVFNLDSRLF